MEQESSFDEKFVAIMCQAASQMRMHASEVNGAYVFIDPLTKQAIHGDNKGTQKERLMSACKALQKYLSIHA